METVKRIDDVVKFLDYLENKNILPKNTTVGKKVALKKFFHELEPEEQTVSYAIENFDTLYNRFLNRHKTEMKGSSLEVYRNRVRTILEDFVEWEANPTQWVKDLTSKRTTTKAAVAKSSAPKRKNASTPSEQPSPSLERSNEPTRAVRVLSFPVSADLEVKVEIPMDGLTGAEITRLGMFLLPYCNDLTPERWATVNWPRLPSPGDTH